MSPLPWRAVCAAAILVVVAGCDRSPESPDSPPVPAPVAPPTPSPAAASPSPAADSSSSPAAGSSSDAGTAPADDSVTTRPPEGGPGNAGTAIGGMVGAESQGGASTTDAPEPTGGDAARQPAESAKQPAGFDPDADTNTR